MSGVDEFAKKIDLILMCIASYINEITASSRESVEQGNFALFKSYFLTKFYKKGSEYEIITSFYNLISTKLAQ